MNEKELRDGEFEKLRASISPLVEKMKSKYPKELNLEGLEPALTHDICMIVKERGQRLKERILSLPAATRSECETENVLCANDIINLIDNHDQPRPEE